MHFFYQHVSFQLLDFWEQCRTSLAFLQHKKLKIKAKVLIKTTKQQQKKSLLNILEEFQTILVNLGLPLQLD